MAETIKAPTVVVSDDIQKLSPERKDIAKKIYDAAVDVGVDPEYALTVGWIENRFKSAGKSSVGAIGPMQIMPKTAKLYGISVDDLSDPDVNIKLGVKILKDGLDRYDGDKMLGLVSYNASSAVMKRFIESGYDQKVLPKETREYIAKANELHDLKDTAQAKEENPFDAPYFDEKADNEPSPFGDVLPKPPNFFDDAKVEEPSIIDQLTTHTLDNPSEPGIALADAYAQSKINDAMQKQAFEKVLQRAQMPPTAPPTPEAPPVAPVAEAPLTSGDKWSMKTVGAQGPGGESTTEAARNYRIQQRLQTAPDVENPKWQPTRGGIIMPRGTQEAVDAERQAMNAQEAQRLVDEALASESPLKRAARTVNQFQERPIPRMFGRVGSFGRVPIAGPLSTGAMAGYAAHKYNQAEELEQRGDVLGASMARLNAYASGIGAIPSTPFIPLNILKGVGMAGSVGLSAAEALKNKLFPYRSVTEDIPQEKPRTQPPQLKKADGGYIPLSLKDVYFHRKARG